jgi:hypothetical protein
MEDLIKSMKAQLYERASSPLIFSFVVSWALWNYRFLLVLTASGSLVEKFAFVEGHLFHTVWDYLGTGLLAPALSALMYIFVYPFPSRFVYSYTQKQQAELKKIQQEIEDETPITQEEARELRGQLRKAAVESDKAIEERNKTIKTLQEDLARIESSRSAAEKLYPGSEEYGGTSKNTSPLTAGQLELLRTVANSRGYFYEDSYLKETGEYSLAERRNNLSRLIKLRLVERGDDDGHDFLVATPNGLEKAVSDAPFVENLP